MSYMYLVPGAAQRRPFTDWLSDVERRIAKRTGMKLAINLVNESYWTGLYHMGEDAWSAADEFVASYRGQL